MRKSEWFDRFLLWVFLGLTLLHQVVIDRKTRSIERMLQYGTDSCEVR